MKRAVRAIIRLVAAGVVVFGGMEIGLEWTRYRLKGVPFGFWPCAAGSILILAGLALFGFSARLADKLSDDFDE